MSENIDSFEQSGSFESSSYESVPGDSDDELFDDSAEVKLKPLTIVKLDPNKFDEVPEVDEIGDMRAAECMINTVVESKQTESDAAPAAKKYKTEELELTKHISDEMNRRGLDFKLKCFSVQHRGRSMLTETFQKLLSQTARESGRLLQAETTNSFFLFYFRNIKSTVCTTGGKNIQPEVFVLASGYAGRQVVIYSDNNFAKAVERRILQFPFQKVNYERDSGPIISTTLQAREGHQIELSVWDLLDSIIGNRTRTMKRNSSLYTAAPGAFCSKAGKNLPVKFDIRKKSMKIRRSLTLMQMGLTLDHMSKISLDISTYIEKESGLKEEEKDDENFQMQDLIREVRSGVLLKHLDQRLCNILESSMTENSKTGIYLTNAAINKWMNTEEIGLYVHKQTGSNKPGRRSKVKTWNHPPSLDEVLECLSGWSGNEFKREWLDDIYVWFSNIKEPLKKFIFSRFKFGKRGTYIYRYGIWLEVSADYLYLIESNFIKLLSSRICKAEEFYLLPWQHVSGKMSQKNEESKTISYELVKFNERNIRNWEKHFKYLKRSEDFEDVRLVVDKETMVNTIDNWVEGKLEIGVGTVNSEVTLVAAKMYLLHECRLDESDYNASHTLLNKLLGNTETKMITSDKVTPHGIELCDILIWNNKTTYLVHVKAKFEGEPIRSVCSQIRNAADHIFRELTVTKGTGMLDKYWDTLTADSLKEYHTIETRKMLQEFGKDKFRKLFSDNEIVFVLACRDVRKNADFTSEAKDGQYNDLKVNMERRIRIAEFKEPDKIIEQLKKVNYLSKEGRLTDNFILKGKADKTKLVEKLASWPEVGSKSAVKLADCLTSGLAKSKSTIAKMEIIRLISDFGKYWIGEKQFQLKICSIDRQFS